MLGFLRGRRRRWVVGQTRNVPTEIVDEIREYTEEEERADERANQIRDRINNRNRNRNPQPQRQPQPSALDIPWGAHPYRPLPKLPSYKQSLSHPTTYDPVSMRHPRGTQSATAFDVLERPPAYFDGRYNHETSSIFASLNVNVRNNSTSSSGASVESIADHINTRSSLERSPSEDRLTPILEGELPPAYQEECPPVSMSALSNDPPPAYSEHDPADDSETQFERRNAMRRTRRSYTTRL